MSALVKHQEQKQDLEYFRNLATIASKSGTHNSSPEVLMNIMLTARDLGISPMKAINGGFYVVNGKISMSTTLMADRIRKEGHSIRIPEWTAQKCVMIGIRKDNGDSIKFEFTMEDAQSAGLSVSPTWKKFPKQMLYNRAMSTIARTLFPDVVGNAYSEDEKWDIMNVPPEKRPEEDPDLVADSPAITVCPSPEIHEMSSSSSQDKMEMLKKQLEMEEISTANLESYLNDLSAKKNQSVEQILDSALLTQLFPKFKSAYTKELSKRVEQMEMIV
jgi:hypothetical protein